MELRDVLTYDPIAGTFTWNKTVNARAVAGSKAGAYRDTGYLVIGWNGQSLLGHRVAFYLMTGEYPTSEVDHINGDRKDNRWSNLRLCKNGTNGQNKKKMNNNTSGFTGVDWINKRNKWRAQLRINGSSKHLGYFSDVNEARAVYVAAKEKAHPLYEGRD